MGDQVDEDEDAGAGGECNISATGWNIESFAHWAFDLEIAEEFLNRRLMDKAGHSVVLRVILDREAQTVRFLAINFLSNFVHGVRIGVVLSKFQKTFINILSHAECFGVMPFFLIHFL